MKNTELLGKKIKQLRLSNDLSLRDLETKSKVSFSFISSIEKNRYNASRETLIALANALDGADKNELLLLGGFSPEEDNLLSEHTAPDWATAKDKRDLKKWLESPEALFFNGIEFTEEDRAKMLGVAEAIFWDARKRNKEDYRKSRDKKQS